MGLNKSMGDSGPYKCSIWQIINMWIIVMGLVWNPEAHLLIQRGRKEWAHCVIASKLFENQFTACQHCRVYPPRLCKKPLTDQWKKHNMFYIPVPQKWSFTVLIVAAGSYCTVFFLKPHWCCNKIPLKMLFINKLFKDFNERLTHGLLGG